MEKHTNSKKYVCIGAGLVCLDILMRGCSDQRVSYKLGGTCGNVMAILSYMGWLSYPIARLDNTDYSKMLLNDVHSCGINDRFIYTNDGATPVIVQRNIVDKYGNPSHKFEILNNSKGRFFLTYKSITKKQADSIIQELNFIPNVFFADRVSPAIIHLAKTFKQKGSLIFFEPSIKPSSQGFFEMVAVSDIVKFANQRINEISFTNMYNDKLFIQTLGADGLRFSLNGGKWQICKPFTNNKVIDTSGAGDWTTSGFLNFLHIHSLSIQTLNENNVMDGLEYAQRFASQSCSYEGARGMMVKSYPEIKALLFD